MRSDLVMNYVEKNDVGDLPDDLEVGQNVTLPYYKVDFDFVLVEA